MVIRVNDILVFNDGRNYFLGRVKEVDSISVKIKVLRSNFLAFIKGNDTWIGNDSHYINRSKVIRGKLNTTLYV